MKFYQFIALLIFSTILFSACGQKPKIEKKEEAILENIPEPVTVNAEVAVKDHHSKLHDYGGWSCPDNLTNFPPLDVRDLHTITVVSDRLPTYEETRDGRSLLYIDPAEIPDARPMDMELPRLARYYSKYTEKNELIVVIQAVIAEGDTVVGFRYLNGGNGSAWFDEVDFVAEEEVKAMGSTPFIFYEDVIDASSADIWKIITDTTYREMTGALFNPEAFQVPDLKVDSEVYYRYAPDSKASRGYITAFWDPVYIQIDYNFDGRHYAQKILLQPDPNGKGTRLQVASGPYEDDLIEQEEIWSAWFRKVKELSEAGVKMN